MLVSNYMYIYIYIYNTSDHTFGQRTKHEFQEVCIAEL